MIYLDNAATTKPCEQAIKAAEDAARSCFGNVSSLHRLGIESEKLMNSAKKTILKSWGCREKYILHRVRLKATILR